MKSTRNGRLMQLAATLSGSIFLINAGMSLVWTSPMVPKLLSTDSPIGIQVSVNEINTIVASLMLGSIFGNLILGLCFDHFGRKGSLLIFAVPNFFSWIIIMFARSVAVLCIGRFILGFSLSVPIGIIVTYIGEIADPDIRGLLGVIGIFLLESAQVFQIVIGSYYSYETGAIICILTPVLFFITFYFIPESPYYYLSKGKIDMAEKSLQIFRGRENVTEELKILQVNVEESMSHKIGLKDLLLNKCYRKPLLIVLGLKTLTQLSGIVAIQGYMKYIFDIADTGLDSDISSIICVSVPLPTLFVAGYLIDKSGRKPLYYASIIGCAIGMLFETIYFFMQEHNEDLSSVRYLPSAGVFILYIFKAFGVSAFSTLYLAELFAPNIKGTASALCLVYGSLLATIITYGIGPFSFAFGLGSSFLVFNIAIVIGFFFVLLVVPETKGKTLVQIQEELDR